MNKRIVLPLIITLLLTLTACQPQKPPQVEIGVKEKALINKFVEMAEKWNMQDHDMWEEIDMSEEIAPYLQAAYEEQKSNNFKDTTKGVDVKNSGLLENLGQTRENAKEYPILEPEIIKSILLFRIHATYAMKILDPNVNVESVYSTTSLFYGEDSEKSDYSFIKIYKNNEKSDDFYTFIEEYYPYVYRQEVRQQIKSLRAKSITFRNASVVKEVCGTDEECKNTVGNGDKILVYKKEVRLWYSKDHTKIMKITK